jgi:hypothetical protein
MFSIIFSSDIKPSTPIQEPSTVAEQVDSSDSEWHKRDTFNLPCEKERSTSVDAA